MNMKNMLWIAAPIALSAGVIWLSAQDPKSNPNDGVKVGELAEKLQAREKAITNAIRVATVHVQHQVNQAIATEIARANERLTVVAAAG